MQTLCGIWRRTPRLVLVLVVPLAACTSFELEYDRMTGTAFPPEQMVAGDAVNLTSIYVDAGYLLAVIEDDVDIAALTGPADPTDPDQYDYITEAELDALMAANRASPVDPTIWSCSWWIFSGTCRKYYVYGIVVDHWLEEADGTRRQGVMGWMWDSDDRSAFVNFYKNGTISGDGGKYLRSAAHEIGHAFNLHHDDGDGDATIMNQTRIVGDDYVYSFSSQSETHLADHPDDCVRPGVGAYGTVNADHAGWAGWHGTVNGC